MKTQFRVWTIIFTLGSLSACGGFSLILIVIAIENSDLGPWQMVIWQLLFSSLFLVGLIAIQRLTKVIRFDNNRLIVKWMFRKKRLYYDYNDIVGFKWGSIYSRPVNYKQIIIYTADDKSIKFSDFEYSNFYKVEAFIKSKLDIVNSDKLKASEEQISIANNWSLDFDLDQIKFIKITLYIFWVVLGFVLWLTVIQDLINNRLSLKIMLVGTISLLLVILSIRKFRKENERKHKITVHNKA